MSVAIQQEKKENLPGLVDGLPNMHYKVFFNYFSLGSLQ